MKRVGHKTASVFAACLSGVLLFLSFPAYSVSWLCWIALIPLLTVIAKAKVKTAFLLSWLCGTLFFAGHFHWVLSIHGYRLLHHGVLIPFMGLNIGLFGAMLSFVSRRQGVSLALILAPFLWVSIEYIRSNLSFMALPAALFAHSQYENLAVIQIAAYTGAYGVSFLIALVNSASALVLLSLTDLLKQRKVSANHERGGREVIYVPAAAMALVGSVLLYGYHELSSPEGEKEVKVAVLQGNIDQKIKWDRGFANFIMKTYFDLSRKAAMDEPSLIVWPEAATPGFILNNRRMLGETQALVRETGRHYLIGSAEHPKFQKSDSPRKGTGNTAVHFSERGDVLGQYLKIRLYPFGEYIPYADVITWPRFMVPNKDMISTLAGKEHTVFEMDGARFGVVICSEVLFPDLSRELVKRGSNFIINITNEGWFNKTAAPYQILAASVYRAVENGRPLVRAANTGVSCFINRFGMITGRVRSGEEDRYVEGYLTRGIRLGEEETLFSAHGDVFAYLCLGVSALALGMPSRSRVVRFFAGEK
jgi:apolipoprotein N-acyltransferase